MLSFSSLSSSSLSSSSPLAWILIDIRCIEVLVPVIIITKEIVIILLSSLWFITRHSHNVSAMICDKVPSLKLQSPEQCRELWINGIVLCVEWCSQRCQSQGRDEREQGGNAKGQVKPWKFVANWFQRARTTLALTEKFFPQCSDLRGSSEEKLMGLCTFMLYNRPIYRTGRVKSDYILAKLIS